MTFRHLHAAFLHALLALLAGIAPPQAAAVGLEDLEVAGFATLGAVTTDRRDMWFTRYGVNYPGKSDPDFSPDSLLGLQASLRLSPSNDITLQALTMEDGNNSYNPRLTLAFLRQTLAPGLSMRIGRLRAPFFMLSDSLYVNYANPWVRPPVEVYGLNPFNDLDGVDLIQNTRMGDVDVEIHPYYGSSTIPFPQGKARLKETWGLNLVLTRGDLSLHLGHCDARFTMVRGDAASRALIAGFSAIGLGAAATDISGTDGRTSFDSLGVQWDDAVWQIIGEVVRRKTDRYVTGSTAWYLSVGRRFGQFTPYAVFARQVLDEPIAKATVPPSFRQLDALWSLFRTSRNNAQRSVTVGARWDFSPKAALKAELTRAQLDRNSWGSYFPRDNALTNEMPGKSANTLSLSVDLTF
jgi:hypothetical protein